ncbi:unnamed protein product [Schistosoma mattheei]|uniref:Uncharacterized protein n=1 Tax=Schistosoma mattheei TaxID=31246 RepID=A0A3P8DL47_9TREM|nr:unnamed protein product [Schistosoma mattheei]
MITIPPSAVILLPLVSCSLCDTIFLLKPANKLEVNDFCSGLTVAQWLSGIHFVNHGTDMSENE